MRTRSPRPGLSLLLEDSLMLRAHWAAGERRGRELEGKQMVGIDPVNSAKGDECVLLFRRLLCGRLNGRSVTGRPVLLCRRRSARSAGWEEVIKAF